MHAEPVVILEVDKRLARFIKLSRPEQPDRASAGELARWHAALEVRKILREACPYDRTADPAAYAAWLAEKYGDDADAIAAD